MNTNQRITDCGCTARLNEIIGTWGVQVAVHAGDADGPDRPLLRLADLDGEPQLQARITVAFCPFCGVRLQPRCVGPAIDADLSALPEIRAAWDALAGQARVGQDRP